MSAPFTTMPWKILSMGASMVDLGPENLREAWKLQFHTPRNFQTCGHSACRIRDKSSVGHHKHTWHMEVHWCRLEEKFNFLSV